MSQSLSEQIIDTVTSSHPQVVDADPSSLASIESSLYQAVAQSAALAIQDATAAMRNLNALNAAVLGQSLALLLDSARATPTLPAGANVDDVQAALEEARKMAETASSTRPSAQATAEAKTETASTAADREIDAAYHHAVAHLRALTEAFAASLDRLNAVSVRQSIRVVEVAAVTAALSRALAVDPSSPDAAEQVALYTNLAQTLIRDLEAWARSI